jgi:hypothetical protein
VNEHAVTRIADKALGIRHRPYFSYSSQTRYTQQARLFHMLKI